MPTGHELKGRIASDLSFTEGAYSNGSSQIRGAIRAICETPSTQKKINDYYEAASIISSAMHQAPSIDNFIDSHRSNPIISEVGKLAIASAILQAERASKLYINLENSYSKLDFGRISETWFNNFFQLVTLNAQKEDLAKRLSRVKIITFNYDRTVEHFLFHSIQNYYRTTQIETTELLSNLTILHPYGKVGNLPWENSHPSVKYGEDVHETKLVEIAKNLRTFTEGTSRESDIDIIRQIVFDAKILTFLGFAYHELNLNLLFTHRGDTLTRYNKQVYGTALGLSESNKKAIAGELASYGKYDIGNITLRKELSAAELLPEYSRSLRIPTE